MPITKTSLPPAPTLLAVFLAASGLVWSLLYLGEARQRFDRESQQLAECYQLVRDIRRLKQLPRQASVGLDSAQQLLQQVSDALEGARIPPESLISVSPSPATRVGLTQYQQRVTRLSFTNVTLGQLATFADRIAIAGEGSVLRDVVLTGPSSPNASKEAELWNARLVLTQRIYSPTSQ